MEETDEITGKEIDTETIQIEIAKGNEEETMVEEKKRETDIETMTETTQARETKEVQTAQEEKKDQDAQTDILIRMANQNNND